MPFALRKTYCPKVWVSPVLPSVIFMNCCKEVYWIMLLWCWNINSVERIWPYNVQLCKTR